MHPKSLSEVLHGPSRILLERHETTDPASASALRKEIKGHLNNLDDTQASLIKRTQHNRADSFQVSFLPAKNHYHKQLRVVTETIFALKTRFNLLAPISKLPDEIIHHILSLRVRSCVDSFRMSVMSVTRSPMNTLAWIPVTHVCRKWREIVIADPNLWTQVSASEPTWAMEMLLRSCHQPLYIKVDFFDLQHDSIETATYILEQLPRIRELTLVVPNTEVVETQLIRAAPILHSLAMRVFRPFTSLSLPEPFLGGITPHLCRLSLENCQMPQNAPLLNRLTHLRLADSQLVLSMAQFLAILRGLENLTELYLVNVRLSGRIGPELAPVTLPRLVMLTIRDFPSVLLRNLRLLSNPDIYLAFSHRHNLLFETVGFAIPSLLWCCAEDRPHIWLVIENTPSFLRIAGKHEHRSREHRVFSVRITSGLLVFVPQIVAAFLSHPPIADHLHSLDLRGRGIRAKQPGSIPLRNLQVLILEQESGEQWLESMVESEVSDVYPCLRTIIFTSPIFTLEHGTVALEHLEAYLTLRIQKQSDIETLILSEPDYLEPVTTRLCGLVSTISCRK